MVDSLVGKIMLHRWEEAVVVMFSCFFVRLSQISVHIVVSSNEMRYEVQSP